MTKRIHSLPDISVIVPCYGHSAELIACLNSLSNQITNVSYEIIVVDSASDSAVEKVVSQFPNVKLIRSKNRLFCGGAKDLGTTQARADFFVFTDSDCIPDQEWIENAYQTLKHGEVMVGGPVNDAMRNHLIAITDNLLQFADVPPGRPLGPIQHIPGCNMGITKEAYQLAGGLPQIRSGDDVTLTLQINETCPQGIFFNPSMKVAHLGKKNNDRIHRPPKIIWLFKRENGIVYLKPAAEIRKILVFFTPGCSKTVTIPIQANYYLEPQVFI